MHAGHLTEPQKSAGSPRSTVSELAVTGMTCTNCARHVTEAIQNVTGVRHAVVQLESGRASVHWSAGMEPDLPAVLLAIKAEGYDASVRETPADSPGHDRPLANWEINL